MLPFLFLLAATADDPQNTNLLNIPRQYQHETVVVVHTVDTQGEMNFVCGKAPEGYVTLGCSNGKLIYMPNPCLYPEEKDHASYAHLLCHEIGHTEGWNHINE